MGFFVLDGKASSDFGVNLSGASTWATPERVVETAEIPGRNGKLITYVGQYRNVEISYPAWIARRFNMKFDAFCDWWNAHTDNYYMLTDTYHPEYYRMARSIGKLDPEVGTIGRSGKFELSFDCKPQKFLRDGNNARTIGNGESIVLRNPTDQDAYPLIVAKIANSTDSILQIYQYETDTSYDQLTFGHTFDATSLNGFEIVYDTEICEATCAIADADPVSVNSIITEDLENDMTGFYIPAGDTVVLESNQGEFDIYPRWYRI